MLFTDLDFNPFISWPPAGHGKFRVRFVNKLPFSLTLEVSRYWKKSGCWAKTVPTAKSFMAKISSSVPNLVTWLYLDHLRIANRFSRDDTSLCVVIIFFIFLVILFCGHYSHFDGVGGAVRFLVVGIIGIEKRPPRGQLWMEQYLISLKYWPI